MGPILTYMVLNFFTSIQYETLPHTRIPILFVRKIQGNISLSFDTQLIIKLKREG